MASIVFSQKAGEDLQRLADFMNDVAPHKTFDTITYLLEKIDLLQTMPKLGKAIPQPTLPTLRQFTIKYGKAGYAVLYSFDEVTQHIIIETIYHKRELQPNLH